MSDYKYSKVIFESETMETAGFFFFNSSFDAYRVASLHNVSLLFDNFIKRFRPYMYLEYFTSRQHWHKLTELLTEILLNAKTLHYV